MDTVVEQGTFAYELWQDYITGSPLAEIREFPLFTDAHIVGEVASDCGPFQLLNTVVGDHMRGVRPSIVLRIAFHTPASSEPSGRTDTSRYHGGTTSDEVAALVSLCLGIRLKAGAANRVFWPDSDPLGRPWIFDYEADPVLSAGSGRQVVPSLLGTHSLDDAALLQRLPSLSPRQSVTVVRAARLYQEAMWIADSAPELAWLILTSAAETAAHAWHEGESPVERMRVSRPDLEPLLRQHGGDKLVEEVAAQIAPYMGATKKFIDFLIAFLPLPPSVRPVAIYQVPWTPQTMKQAFRVVYGHRSRALHGGIPFPASMCDMWHRDEHDIRSEMPTPLAMSTRGGTWTLEDAPLTFATFEYVVRHALLAWWSTLLPSAQF